MKKYILIAVFLLSCVFASSSPYIDKRPLKNKGKAEVRKYCARGVINDAEIGQMSKIVEVVFAG